MENPLADNDFSCNCGFWASGQILENEDFLEMAVKLHAEEHMKWRMAYVFGIFSGNKE
jgi:hypothetical protein